MACSALFYQRALYKEHCCRRWPQFCVRSHGWPYHHAWVESPVTPCAAEKGIPKLRTAHRCRIRYLSVMYRALWDRRNEGAININYWLTRIVPECLRSHNAWYIMLKSDFDMNCFDILRSRNLPVKFWSGRWRTMHCRKFYTICKLAELIPVLQSGCLIPNWVSAKTAYSSSTNHSQTRYRAPPVILLVAVRVMWPKQKCKAFVAFRFLNGSFLKASWHQF